MTEGEPPKTDQIQIDISLTFDPSQMSYGEIRAELVEKFERIFYTSMTARHGGNLSAAAKEVKMDRKYLYDMGKKRGLR